MADVRRRRGLTIRRDNGLPQHADGSNGFQRVVCTGWQIIAVKRVPAARRQGKSVVHRQQNVATVTAGRELAQMWEDEETT